MLTLTNVSLTYPGASHRAVDDVSLEVQPGQTLALLGPSGCGKSSLLRAVAGLEDYAGTIAWQDLDLAGIPVHERGFGLMFQEGQLFPHRTVGGNVAFGLEMTRMPKAQRKTRVNELLDLVGLAGYAARAISTLSGGEQQRVALARSLAPGPELLLLDEPLSALDRHLRERLSSDLREILLATGTTALYVTHDQDEAFAIADTVGLMREGQVRQIGTPAEVWAAPVDAESAAFLGYRIVDDGELALGPRALHLSREGSTWQKTGRVENLRVVRGEMVAQVDIPGWGVHPVLAEYSPRVGEKVVVNVRIDHTVRFSRNRFTQELPATGTVGVVEP